MGQWGSPGHGLPAPFPYICPLDLLSAAADPLRPEGSCWWMKWSCNGHGSSSGLQTLFTFYSAATSPGVRKEEVAGGERSFPSFTLIEQKCRLDT